MVRANKKVERSEPAMVPIRARLHPSADMPLFVPRSSANLRQTQQCSHLPRPDPRSRSRPLASSLVSTASFCQSSHQFHLMPPFDLKIRLSPSTNAETRTTTTHSQMPGDKPLRCHFECWSAVDLCTGAGCLADFVFQQFEQKILLEMFCSLSFIC